MQSIDQIEGELILSLADTDFKTKVNRFFNNKVFGSFEQMRVEMEMRYKAQQVFLTTADKIKLHGYWVPCK
jgi:hypothetical protein